VSMGNHPLGQLDGCLCVMLDLFFVLEPTLKALPLPNAGVREEKRCVEENRELWSKHISRVLQ
jgi:hypothetical protein